MNLLCVLNILFLFFSFIFEYIFWYNLLLVFVMFLMKCDINIDWLLYKSRMKLINSN